MKRLKFYWNADEEQLKQLRKLARVTGHASIRDFFGTLVTEGLRVIEASLHRELAAVKAEAKASEESNVQGDSVQSEGDDAANLSTTP